MNLKLIEPPRQFVAGFKEHRVIIKDCAHLKLAVDEQVTFLTESKGEYDVVRKSWGFYATPSVNHRLPRYNLRSALVRNRLGHVFVVIVEKNKADIFQEYMKLEKMELMAWLDELNLSTKLEKLSDDKKK